MTPRSAPQSRYVRAARLPDLDVIRSIERRAFEPSRRSSPASLRRALRSAFQRVLVLEVGGVLAGYLVLWPFRHTWRVYNLATDPQRRNQGVAGTLLSAAEDEARRAGACRLVLESRDEAGLLAFYRHRGFLETHRLPGYYASGEDAIRMELPLAPAS